jgi:hypothetical protein
MRSSVWVVPSLAMSLVCAFIAPAQAQTYDPRYPVCIQTYGYDGNYIDCSYASIGQCQATASGRAAQCLVNPYYATGSVRRRYGGY